MLESEFQKKQPQKKKWRVLPELSGELQSSQDNEIAHVLERDRHALEIPGNSQHLCPLFFVCLKRVLVPQGLCALCTGPSMSRPGSDKVVRRKAERVTTCT